MNDSIEIINSALEAYLPDGEDVVSRAIRYSVGNGGKRIRPYLTLEFCRACGGDVSRALPYACAVEMIHTYSLIHDDLPCMDDDDLRRGKPSCHVEFGYANALLAGDALLTLAFETLAKAELPPQTTVSAVSILASAAGWSGMVGGQVMDLANEGRRVTARELEATDRLKTGALIKAACRLGCLAAGREDAVPFADEYADCLGIAFQIVDDILDVTSSADLLGKPVGSDEQNEKSTYVTFYGIEESRRTVSELTSRAKKALDGIEGDTSSLAAFADAMENRKN